jgi:predicted nucleic acid-binding protein
VKPVRLRDAPLVARYDAFFGKDDLELIDLERNIVDRATALRTQLGISTPDALHMASALEHHAEVFLTGDADLSRCHDIQLEVLTKP